MEEDSLYFRHFLKFVYKNTAKIMAVWIKLRKLKPDTFLKKKDTFSIIESHKKAEIKIQQPYD